MLRRIKKPVQAGVFRAWASFYLFIIDEVFQFYVKVVEFASRVVQFPGFVVEFGQGVPVLCLGS